MKNAKRHSTQHCPAQAEISNSSSFAKLQTTRMAHPFTANLSKDAYEKGFHLLTATLQKNIAAGKSKHTMQDTMATILLRCSDSFLDKHRASRAPDYSKTDKDISSLPGIGDDYWQDAKDHMRITEFAPYLYEANHLVDDNFVTRSSRILKPRVEKLWTQLQSAAYSIKFKKAEVINIDDMWIYYIPVMFQHALSFQDGQPIREKTFRRLFHGTRETNIVSIMQKGLQSSRKSHKRTGAWVNSCLREAVKWNYSILDMIPGLALDVLCNTAELEQNADIMQGSDHRFLQELKTGKRLPSLVIQGIITLLPNKERLRLRKRFRNACRACAQFLFDLPMNKQFLATEEVKRYLARSLYHLTAEKLAYGSLGNTAYSIQAGYDNKEEYEAIAHISNAVARLLWILQKESDSNRMNDLRAFNFDEVPAPMQTFFIEMFPNLTQYVIIRKTYDHQARDVQQVPNATWYLASMVETFKFGITTVNKETQATDEQEERRTDRRSYSDYKASLIFMICTIMNLLALDVA